jgi:hypothetical protein
MREFGKVIEGRIEDEGAVREMSGEGREGPRAALEHLTEERVLLWDATSG